MSQKSRKRKSGMKPAAERIPIEHQIDLRFPHFEGMVTRISSNLSTSGMFIQSDNPPAPGTEFGFRLRIEQWSPIQGTARVVWARSRTEGPERPAGMGVKFLDLDSSSRRMIRWLVDKHLQEGGTPFDLETVPAGASGGVRDSGRVSSGSTRIPRARARGDRRATSDRAASRPRTPSGESSRRIRNLLLLILLLAALAAGVYGGYVLWLESRWARPQASPAPAGDQSPPAETEAAGQADAADSAQPMALAQPASSVTALVQAWAAAWTSRQAETLLELYSPDFEPEGTTSRSAWLRQTEQRMRQAQHIRVAVSALEVSYPSASTARASFFQSYRSDRDSETRRIVMDLEIVEGEWRIRRQRFTD